MNTTKAVLLLAMYLFCITTPVVVNWFLSRTGQE